MTSELSAYRADLKDKGEHVADLTRELDDARVALRAAVLEAVEAGMSEVEASKVAGVTRDSVRRWQGK